jgi:hypothetical protein
MDVSYFYRSKKSLLRASPPLPTPNQLILETRTREKEDKRNRWAESGPVALEGHSPTGRAVAFSISCMENGGDSVQGRDVINA